MQGQQAKVPCLCLVKDSVTFFKVGKKAIIITGAEYSLRNLKSQDTVNSPHIALFVSIINNFYRLRDGSI